MWILSLGWVYPLEENIATHSSFLVWKIPWTGEPGGLLSLGCDLAHTGNKICK